MKAPLTYLYKPAPDPARVKFFSLKNPDRSPRHGALSPRECDALVKHVRMHYAPREATVGHGGQSRIDGGLRRSTVRWLSKEDADLGWLFTRMQGLVEEANDRLYGFDITSFRDIQFTEYDARDGGKYDWHADSYITGHRPNDRKLTLVIQLSDPEDYEGGQFEIEDVKLGDDDFSRQGSAIVFPSFARHRANLVTRGIRRSLVTWVWGPIR